ncbi:hypothetical protein JMJ77_0014310 [Colletotrichum scovillei]|uniref:Uncharacterized protein n=1 Tax=Colletotrichum scovillei TaxID=1209932 RepID=A0A9P7R5Q1_9PEZI|nr:hypothetical protein JMJ77_0014310 [Colletotrichum scovillei]KAG7065837.1 hypothetical protein JMJ78_0012583 [Colletotrichum scovillei]KAG7068439.1 hypothetical protein JMJ76_0008128 [Colletotrichum scovillei]
MLRFCFSIPDVRPGCSVEPAFVGPRTKTSLLEPLRQSTHPGTQLLTGLAGLISYFAVANPLSPRAAHTKKRFHEPIFTGRQQSTNSKTRRFKTSPFQVLINEHPSHLI